MDEDRIAALCAACEVDPAGLPILADALEEAGCLESAARVRQRDGLRYFSPTQGVMVESLVIHTRRYTHSFVVALEDTADAP